VSSACNRSGIDKPAHAYTFGGVFGNHDSEDVRKSGRWNPPGANRSKPFFRTPSDNLILQDEGYIIC